MENNELQVAENVNNGILDFGNYGNQSNVNVETFSNIKDKKVLFNLESHVDQMLNDCVGEAIRVKKVLIRKFYKPLKEPIVDEETGEILKDTELKVSCIIIDEQGKSYATGSKTFTFDMMKLLGQYGGAEDLEAGIDIKVVKVAVGEKGNKALSFELL